MIVSGTPDDARIRHTMRDGKLTLQTLILNPEDGTQGPHAFLVEQSPTCEIGAHFHHTSQFQLAVGGRAKLGKHDVRALSVHFAQRHTTYGPIVASDEGFSYLTLRPVKDVSGAHYMPESNRMLDRNDKRWQVTRDAAPPSGAADLKSRKAAVLETVIEPDETGLAAWLLRLPPKAAFAAPRKPAGEGQFHVVVSGSMVAGSSALGRLATTWVSAETPAFDIVAGDDGLEVMIMQFPLGSWLQ